MIDVVQASIPNPAFDSGPEFEQRAAALTRSIHDPSGNQGQTIWNGTERDGLFFSGQSVFAYEFTTDRKREKAVKDGNKLGELLSEIRRNPKHAHKSLLGRFITQHAVTADQRIAIQDCSRRHGVQLVAMSLVDLRNMVFDAEDYLARRIVAPFGSAGKSLEATAAGRKYVEATLKDSVSGHESGTKQLVGLLRTRRRLVIRGDFGIGKSAALAQVFQVSRKEYFRNKDETKIPLHINLRDARGLLTASEVLSRHCQQIGFADDRSLIAAWRAGFFDLLLDGFDELVPQRYSSDVKDLESVRKAALQPVRELISETPDDSAVLVAGRTQYFSSDREMLESLGMRDAALLDLNDLNEAQVREFLGDQAKVLPEWMPTRPVLLQFWLAMGMLESTRTTPGEAWNEFLERIAQREAERVNISSTNLLKLIAGIARSCQVGSIENGVGLEEQRSVYRRVFGNEPNEEGIQTLMRLPGLVPVDEAADPHRRRFQDEDLRDAAFGIELAGYVLSPDQADHPLNQAGECCNASAGLAGDVAAANLAHANIDPTTSVAALRARKRRGLWDAVLLEIARCADALGAKHDSSLDLTIVGTLIPYLNANGEGFAGCGTFVDCLIDALDLSSLDLDGQTLPEFRRCAVDKFLGHAVIPSRLASRFSDCTIQSYTAADQTNDGILTLHLPTTEKVALVILRKVFAQRGSGRKETALPRGLPQRERSLVPDALNKLVSAGYVTRASSRSADLVIPVRSRYGDAMRILENASRGIPEFRGGEFE
jgi:hypothetical protein